MKKFDSINVIPFIDIMLVLLAIVLTTSTFIARGIIPLELPNAKTNEIKKSKFITISIKKDGQLFFEKNKVSKNGLLSLLLKKSKKSNIAIRCDKNAKFQSFINVMQIVKNLGFDNISIITKE